MTLGIQLDQFLAKSHGPSHSCSRTDGLATDARASRNGPVSVTSVRDLCWAWPFLAPEELRPPYGPGVCL